MTAHLPRPRALAAGLLLLAGPLAACSGAGHTPPAPDVTVRMDPSARPVDGSGEDPGEDYAPVPEGLGPGGVVRLVWETDPGMVYEYPMGDSRPR